MCYFHCVEYYLIITAIISISIVYFIWKKVLGFDKMSLDNMDEPLSDDEVYFGKLTLKELKKHFLWNKQPKIMSAVNSPKKNCEDENTSLKILEAHSQPNLLAGRENFERDSLDDSQLGDKTTDNSFIKLENMVENLCVSQGSNEKTELNNTLEVIEYILNNPPSSIKKPNEKFDNKMLENKDSVVKVDVDGKGDMLQASPLFDYHTVQKNLKTSPEHPQLSPTKSVNKFEKCTDEFTTPRDKKIMKPIFKTPAQPLSSKKPSATSLKKTPGRSNPYQHISSPVASYIKNCPIVPLVKDVHPKKPLPGPSSIPKIVKSALPVKPSNKENINLPSVAYKSAKKTRVIDIPDDQKLPQSQWAKKIMTSLPRPTVMKHNHREINVAKKKLQSQTEDSFADLSYHQAEVSVCTQKSAFKTNKN